MGRRAQGLRFRRVGGIWTARFRAGGKRCEYSTGLPIVEPPRAGPREEVVRAGESLFAQALAGRRIARIGAAPASSAALSELLAWWLTDLAVRPKTRAQYEIFAAQWLREWKRVAELTESAIAARWRVRLREVTRKSVLNESSALRRFAQWALELGLVSSPIVVPAVPAAALGVPYRLRRRTRAPELSEDEVELVLAALPEWSGVQRFPVRARYVLAWETTLRPETIARLEVPRHWAPGSRTLRITADIDKEGAAREVPLTPRAREALASVAPSEGLIFPGSKVWRYVADAAAVLPPAKAAIFCAQHIRSAAITRLLERSGNLPGTMHAAGHRNAATTSRYVRPTLRAAETAMASIMGEDSGEAPRVARRKHA